MIYVVVVWQEDGTIGEDRFVGPFRKRVTAEEYAENVRHALGFVLDARVEALESAWDQRTWLELREWHDLRGGDAAPPAPKGTPS